MGVGSYQRVYLLLALGHKGIKHRIQQRLLVGKMVKKSAFCHASGVRDGLNGHAGQTLAGGQLGRTLNKRGTHLLWLLFTMPAALTGGRFAS